MGTIRTWMHRYFSDVTVALQFAVNATYKFRLHLNICYLLPHNQTETPEIYIQQVALTDVPFENPTTQNDAGVTTEPL